jgi:cytochrome c553
MNKKIAALLAVTVFVAGSATFVFAAVNPGTGVNGSMHDMNTKYPGNNDAMGRVCVFCHTPHNANMGGEAAGSYPLWNHTLPPTTGWTSYVWATPLNSTLNQDPMAGPSRLCMSCHDGVIAPDQHNGSNGGNAAQAGSGPLTGFKAIGLLGGVAGTTYDLTDDHPIGFSYDEAVTARNITGTGATTEVVPKTERFATALGATNTTGTYNDPTRNGKRAIQDVLYNGSIMTCASCHEVHNKDNVAPTITNGGAQNNYLLWADEKDSLICLSCHKK